jgi:MFS family permease
MIFSLFIVVYVCLFDKYNENIQQINEETASKIYEYVEGSQNNNFELNRLFWFVTTLTLALYAAIVPYNYILSGFLVETWFYDYPKDEALVKAGFLISICITITCCLIPVFGYFIDKLGKRANIFTTSCLMAIFSFLLFFCLPPIYPMLLLSITSSLCAASIWPCINVIVKPDSLVNNL